MSEGSSNSPTENPSSENVEEVTVDEGEIESDDKRKRSISKKACEHCKRSHACCEGMFSKIQNHQLFPDTRPCKR